MSDIVSVEPVIVKVFLYRNNYKDRLLIGALRPYFFSDNHVMATDLRQVLTEEFSKEISQVGSFPKEHVHNRVTSPFFLDQMLREYTNVKYFHVQILPDELYSRRGDDGFVSFDHRIVYSRIDLSTLSRKPKENLERVLRLIGVYDSTLPSYDRPPYFEIRTNELLSKLEDLRMASQEESPDWLAATEAIQFFSSHLNSDDANLLTIMQA